MRVGRRGSAAGTGTRYGMVTHQACVFAAARRAGQLAVDEDIGRPMLFWPVASGRRRGLSRTDRRQTARCGTAAVVVLRRNR